MRSSAATPNWNLCSSTPRPSARTCHAFSAQKSGEQAIGRSRGGLTTRLHRAADAVGYAVQMTLTGGQAHGISQAEALINGLKCEHAIADKGYDSRAFVDAIEASGAQVVIPARSNRHDPRRLDIHLYRERNQVERLFCRRKECR